MNCFLCKTKWLNKQLSEFCVLSSDIEYVFHLRGNAVKAYRGGHFPSGDTATPIVMSDVECDCWDENLDECFAYNYGVISCDHSEDAGVSCNGRCTLITGSHLTYLYSYVYIT